MAYYGKRDELIYKRKVALLSQNAVAAQLGISQAMYSNIENGYCLPTDDVHDKLIAMFDLKEDYFSKKEEE